MIRLAQRLKTCQIHANRLRYALEQISHLYPFSVEAVEQIHGPDLGYLELFTARMAKLQGQLGEKVFPDFLVFLEESIENASYIDSLNKLEKMGFLPSTAWWQDLRKLNETLAHEYPDAPVFTTDNLKKAYVQAIRLLAFWESFHLSVQEKGLI